MLTDYSNFKHIDLDTEHDYKEGDMIASVLGNSFGDQIIHYRILETANGMQGFETIAIVYFHEGHHANFEAMRKEALYYKKEYLKKKAIDSIDALCYN